MDGLPEWLLISAVIVFVLARQFFPQRISADAKGWWVLPAVLVVVTVRKAGLIDQQHEVMAVLLLIGSVLVGILSGALWAWSMKVWSDESGAYWARAGAFTPLVIVAGVLARLVLHGGAAVLGVYQGAGSTMLGLAFCLLMRSGLVQLRARGGKEALRAMLGGTHLAHVSGRGYRWGPTPEPTGPTGHGRTASGVTGHGERRQWH